MTRAKQGRGPRRTRGFTMVELVVSIVVFAIAVFGVANMLSTHALRSSQRMITVQAAAIAASYLEEAQQLPLLPGANVVEANRSLYNDVRDYGAINDTGARDRTGMPIANLASYNVTVRTAQSALGPVPATQSRLITVTVRHAPTGFTVVMNGYRTQHP